MTLQHTTLALPDGSSVTLTLPDPCTPAGIARVGAAIDGYLRTLSRDLAGAGAPDPGAIEYASWFPQRH
jgi:hypothetical protein